METGARVGAREADSAATRRTILDAAEALLASGGEDGLSIRELCARAGVTAPTIYHHFGDKAGVVERVVDECFADFDRAVAGRTAPSDPVEALRWGFDRYVDYGQRHPAHYRLMFQPRRARRTPGSLASYDGLRRRVATIAAAGRLVVDVDDAAAAFWATVHGVTSLLVSGFIARDAPMIALVRESMIAQLTMPATLRRDGTNGGNNGRKRRTRS